MAVYKRLRSSPCMVAGAALAVILTEPFSARRAGGDLLAAQPPAAADLWLVPGRGAGSTPNLADAAAALAAGRAADALAPFARATSDPVLGGYARLYLGRAQLTLRRFDDAAESARLVISRSPAGPLGEGALWLLADAAEGREDWDEALQALQALADLPTSTVPAALLRLGRVALKLNNRDLAYGAFSKLYYDLPLSDEAKSAESELSRFVPPPDPEALRLGLSRAQLLYSGRRYADARKAFASVRGDATGDERDAIDLRIAQCDYHLNRYAAARDEVRAYLADATKGVPEARYYLLSAERALHRDSEYVSLVRAFVTDYPNHPLAEVALNELGTYYILNDDDGAAAEVFADMYRRFPVGAYAERGAWKAGWWAFRQGNLEEAIKLFETASLSFPRSDYRPAWLYWAARAHAKLGQTDAALTGYHVAIADYRNSYYGREASRQVGAIQSTLGRSTNVVMSAFRVAPTRVVTPGTPPANAGLIERLMAAGLWDDAIAELQEVQRVSGPSPLLDATLAYALNRRATCARRSPRCGARIRSSWPKAAKRCRPNLCRSSFRCDTGTLIQEYAASAQARSVSRGRAGRAGVYLPGRRPVVGQRVGPDADPPVDRPPLCGAPRHPAVLARRQLTDPEVNVRIGTAYFADLMKQFGDLASALAAYNAGESRVAALAGRAARASTADEFIDDIPFPETQNYVKRILGTAEDYRSLYGAAASA